MGRRVSVGRNMTLVGGSSVRSTVISLAIVPQRPPHRRRLRELRRQRGGVYDAEGRLVGVVEGYRTARVSFEGNASPQYINVPSGRDVRRFAR